MKREQVMNTAEYSRILGEISSTADGCKLAEVTPLSAEYAEGTDITAKLQADTEWVFELMSTFHEHSVSIMPDALSTIQDSFVEQDKALGEKIMGGGSTICVQEVQ